MAAFWVVLYLLIGLGLGVISGILGIGGGVVLVPILMWCGYKYKMATGTSLAVLVPPIGLPAAWKAYSDGNVDLGAAACIAGAFAVGAFFGRYVNDAIDPHIFKICFGVFMMFVAVRFILSGSDEVTMAVAGIGASLVSMIGFVALHQLGRHHTNQSDLGHHIRTSRDEGHTDPDYYI